MTKIKDAEERARELLGSGKTDEKEIIKLLQKGVGCSSTTAIRALKRARGKYEKGVPIKAEIEVGGEKKGEIPFIKKHEEVAKIDKKKEIEEIAPPEPAIPPERAEELNVFRDMLRGIHITMFSKEGLLGKKYGHKKEICVGTSDNLYRYLVHKFGADVLESHSFELMLVSYGYLITDPIGLYVKERREQSEKEKKEKPKEKTETEKEEPLKKAEHEGI